jgi:hypothetical protein
MEKTNNETRHDEIKTMMDPGRHDRMPTISNDQKRKARIYKLTQALVDMRPGRRRGDLAAQKRISAELATLRTAELKTRAP